MPLLVPPHLPVGALSGRPQPCLTGAGITLRPWTDADVEVLVLAYADPGIQRWHRRSLDEDEAAATIRTWQGAWATETGASWAVTDPDRGGSVVGRVAFRELDLADGFAEVGYWVLPSARGHGVATHAVRTLCRWAFDVAGLQRIELQHSVHNTASCRVASAAGFVAEGTLRASVLHNDGWHDMHVHGRVRSDEGDLGSSA